MSVKTDPNIATQYTDAQRFDSVGYWQEMDGYVLNFSDKKFQVKESPPPEELDGYMYEMLEHRACSPSALEAKKVYKLSSTYWLERGVSLCERMKIGYQDGLEDERIDTIEEQDEEEEGKPSQQQLMLQYHDRLPSKIKHVEESLKTH